MSKFTQGVRDALALFFDQGDVPTPDQFHELIQAVQDGIQEHEHLATGGPGTGTGKTGPLARVVHRSM